MTESPHVLIAEDNPGLAKVLSFKFKSCGFNPVVCGDGMTAWDAFQNTAFAAVVSDQEMPRMTGVQLCRNIRDSKSSVPFFLVTGRQLELSSTGIADELTISQIFAKPFSPQTIIAAVNEAIESSVAS